MRGNQDTNKKLLDDTSKSVVFAQTDITDQTLKTKTEFWRRDKKDNDLWHGDNGLIINTAALREREAYYDVKIVRD